MGTTDSSLVPFCHPRGVCARRGQCALGAPGEAPGTDVCCYCPESVSHRGLPHPLWEPGSQESDGSFMRTTAKSKMKEPAWELNSDIASILASRIFLKVKSLRRPINTADTDFTSFTHVRGAVLHDTISVLFAPHIPLSSRRRLRFPTFSLGTIGWTPSYPQWVSWIYIQPPQGITGVSLQTSPMRISRVSYKPPASGPFITVHISSLFLIHSTVKFPLHVPPAPPFIPTETSCYSVFRKAAAAFYSWGKP